MLLGPDLFSKYSGLKIVNKSWIFQQSGSVGEKTFVRGFGLWALGSGLWDLGFGIWALGSGVAASLLRLALCVGFGNLLICSLQLAFNYRFLGAAAARVS
jgi:hypothetical protein